MYSLIPSKFVTNSCYFNQKVNKYFSLLKFMQRKRFIGLVLIGISLVMIASNVSITGAVIGTSITNSISFVAIVLLVVGLILTSQREINYAREILEQGRYVDDTKELKKIARKMGYNLMEGYKEGTRVYSGHEVLTVIPNHRKIGGKGTAKSILEALATGESSFTKKYAHA